MKPWRFNRLFAALFSVAAAPAMDAGMVIAAAPVAAPAAPVRSWRWSGRQRCEALDELHGALSDSGFITDSRPSGRRRMEQATVSGGPLRRTR